MGGVGKRTTTGPRRVHSDGDGVGDGDGDGIGDGIGDRDSDGAGTRPFPGDDPVRADPVRHDPVREGAARTGHGTRSGRWAVSGARHRLESPTGR
ncbi:hypothetical protein [Streptomyces sp. NPDC006309]|uniref:hypothetical protein n=1 Tax=Streptomyces sp. NPDC006309 TaxID=3156749 RepID=UPI0033B86998